MHPGQFSPTAPGKLISIPSHSGQEAWAFIPNLLPPAIESSHEIAAAAARATLALGNLNGVGTILNNADLLIRPFIQREAVASSRIEGTRVEFEQIALQGVKQEPFDRPGDIEEVNNYIAALYSGWNRPSERPFSAGFLMSLHQQLLQGTRGQDRHPGQLRQRQVVIGGAGDDAASARFVPPPPELVRELVENLCTYIVEIDHFASPIRLALIHYQFETIHPFEDGNGRLGRLMLPLVLGLWGELDLPLLYLSEYLEDHRSEYIDRLLAVSTRGDWHGWILFMLNAISNQAREGARRVRSLHLRREAYRARYQSARSARVLTVVDHLFDRPHLTVTSTVELLDVTRPTASQIINQLVADGILQEVTGRSWGREYVATEILTVMQARSSTA